MYAEVNGIDLYYETHGEGRPLILLHGGLMAGELFAPIIPAMTAGHQVITVDLQGHGRTADIDRPLDARLMADDVAALIGHLGLDHPDLAGYSLGGKVGWQVAFRHPETIRRLVTVSAAIRSDAFYPELIAQQAQVNAAAAEFMKGTPMWELYQRIAPRPEDFPRLLDKIGAAMQVEFDFTDDVKALTVPTLVMAADCDMVPPSHFVEVFALLGGGVRDGGWDGSGRPEGGHQFAIVPGTTHYDVTESPLFPAIALSFLDQE